MTQATNPTPDHDATRDATISHCGRYRYILTRRIDDPFILMGQNDKPMKTAVFVMLNPSTADAMNDDPTIRRCIGFALRWGCDHLSVLNLFAYRATDPTDMKRTKDPVGPENRDWFSRTLQNHKGGPVVCAWGANGGYRGQDIIVLRWISEHGIQPMALGLTQAGYPKHPLYLPNNAELIEFTHQGA